jgi:hypothetical protein
VRITVAEEAGEAARALRLRQNLTRVALEVRRHKLLMLDADDPVKILQEAVVARAGREGRVEVRIYGDSRPELLQVCKAVLDLWESEGLMGVLPTSGLTGAPAAPAVAPEAAAAKARLEDEERRLTREKQHVLSEQVVLGTLWQQAEARVNAAEREVLAARKEVADLEAASRRGAPAPLSPARTRLSAAEGRLAAANAELERVRRQRAAHAERVAELDRAIAKARTRLAEASRKGSGPPPDIKVYRVREVVERCRERRIEG